jgi:hypothetical protein
MARLPLLISHAGTKFGSKAWEFATPLLLLEFSPDGGLIAPTIFGLVTFVLKFMFGPAAGTWMDRTPRLRVIRQGILLQSIGVVAALGVYGLLCWSQSSGAPPSLPWTLIGMMVACGVVESIGALISSVAVKKDWVPTIWQPGDPELASINTAMQTIDLVAEIFGPLAAGVALQLLGSGAGFVVVGLVNVVSFAFELTLLLRVYHTEGALAAPKSVHKEAASGGNALGFLQAWPVFVSQPSGVPLLVVSYALLYFTVLSPHGVVLTAYLQTREVDPPALAAFRAAGALSGVAGMSTFRALSSRFELRPLASAHLWVLAVAVASAAASFYATEGAYGLTMPMIAFLSLVVISRFGLYGFDLAVLQLQQMHVDEQLRGSVGAVESSLCSLGTAALFVGTLVTSSMPPEDHPFDMLVYLSAAFVGSAALVYTAWLCLFHEHEHEHPLFESTSRHTHKHTTQQIRALEESPGRKHIHLHLHLPWQWSGSHAHEHEHGNDHDHSHSHAHRGAAHVP